MTVDRSIWDRRIYESFANTYPCPRCSKGQVRRGDNPVTLIEPNHSRREHGNEDWDPDWIRMSFTTMLECSNAACGEIVSVSCHAAVDYYQHHGHDGEPEESGYHTLLRPVSMFPAPPLFKMPKNLPHIVKMEISLAFQLFWTDLSTSTSRIRTSLERVLDDKGIASSVNDKRGCPKRLTLFQRLDLFEKAMQDSELAESLTAMRIVGNLGTHGDRVVEDDYFNLLDVYEDALSEIYESRKAKLSAKKKALIALNK